MSRIDDLFNDKLKIINVGLTEFGADLKKQGAEIQQVDWRPPAISVHNFRSMKIDRSAANKTALDRILSADPWLTGIGRASEVVPGMHEKMILHAGPPITWKRMSGPMRGAVIGAIIYEGLAEDPKGAEELASSGEVEFSPWHEHDGVGPMAGVATSRMPVWIIEDKTHGNKAYCTLNEGLGKVLRYGAFSSEVIDRLRWMERDLAPLLQEALKLRGPINLKSLIAQAMQMGDEVHNRNRAGTSLFIREIAPAIIDVRADDRIKKRVFEFINGNDHFFLNLSMPAAKVTMRSIEWIEGSTIVSTMARNGTDFGIRIAGLKGKWFTAPAQNVRGLYFPGFSDKDANPDIGDSAITETMGVGGFSMAAAPAIIRFVGGTSQDAIKATLRMYEITQGESQSYQIPGLDFRGAPTGIDIVKVCELGILPQINTGIAHKDAGIGQVGAGLVNPPMECFQKAIEAFVEEYS